MPSSAYPASNVPVPVDQVYPYPAAIIPPEPTYTPAFTPTPSITPTPFPTPTQLLPTVSPPVQTVVADHLPPITHDLLFISDPYLKRWDHVTSEIVTLAGPISIPVRGIPPGSVIDYSSSRDGKRIAITVFVGPQDRDYKIYLLDPATGSQIPVLDVLDSARPLDLKMSPDGKWLAYILQDKLGMQPATATPSTLTIAYTSPPRGGIVEAGKIWAVQTDQPGTAIEVGYCAIKIYLPNIRIPCHDLLWSPDSKSIAWSDGVGLWVANPGTLARLVIENEPWGKSMGNYYWQQAWSPSSNYILARASHFEGDDRVVIDILSGQATVLPNSFEYSVPAAQITWLQDERLFVVRPGLETMNLVATGESWRFNPHTSSLFLEGSFLIPVKASYPLSPFQIDETHLGFVMVNPDFANHQERGIYIFDIPRFRLEKVTGIMPHARINASWVPDGSAVLITGEGAYLAPTDGSALYELNAVLKYAWHFTWLESP